MARPPGPRLEVWAWYLMRVSAVILAGSVTFHMYWNTVVYDDVDVTWDLIVRRYQNPGWRLFDLLLLGVAVLHGFGGLRTILQDHLRPGPLRILIVTVFHLLWISVLTFGAFVILSFPWRAA